MVWYGGLIPRVRWEVLFILRQKYFLRCLQKLSSCSTTGPYWVGLGLSLRSPTERIAIPLNFALAEGAQQYGEGNGVKVGEETG